MVSSAVATIRTAALQENLRRARSAAPDSPVLAIVKADAYGHGLERVAAILSSADAFGVARIPEALRLRAAGVDKPVIVMSERIDREEIAIAREHALQLVIHSKSQVEMLAALRDGPPLSVWLKIDSGMGRLGLPPELSRWAIELLRGNPAVVPDPVLMTHLACADERDNATTIEQLRRFGAAIGEWSGDVSIANSAGLLAWPDALKPGAELHYTGRNWLRPGLMLYGVSPFAGEAPAAAGLRPAMIFDARLIDIHDVPEGACVGYGGDWRAPRDSRIGVIDAGYADGYPWAMPGGTPVRVGAAHAPIIGRVSMDMITIDLTDVTGVEIGDLVTLWGDDPHVSELAERARSSPYELLTGVGNRVERLTG